ncbi:hypothetical protein D3C76_1073280 [compost metagenome]
MSRSSGPPRWLARSLAIAAGHGLPCAGMPRRKNLRSVFAPLQVRTSSPSTTAWFWYSPCNRSCASCRPCCVGSANLRYWGMWNCSAAPPWRCWSVTPRRWPMATGSCSKPSARSIRHSSGCMATTARNRPQPARHWDLRWNLGAWNWPTVRVTSCRSMPRSIRQ